MENISSTTLIILFILVVWSLVWKGLALWRAAQHNHLGWFIVLLIFNTIGILELLYYFIFSKREGGPITKSDEKKSHTVHSAE